MTPQEALIFVQNHGVVLESARGPVPDLAAAVVGAPIRGSWWGHRKGREIFRLTRLLRDTPDVLVCRLVDGKITYVHRRLWPSLVRLAHRFSAAQLAALRELHTERGHHEIHRVAFPHWVPAEIQRAAKGMTEAEAAAALGPWLGPVDRARGARGKLPATPDAPIRS
jgi:hypothetical protein